LIKGRFFTDQDREGAPRVTVVDEEMVRRYWPNEDPIGKRIGRAGRSDSAPQWIEVVGVVGHTKHEGLDAEDRVQLYLPSLQVGGNSMWVAIRTDRAPMNLAASVRAAVYSVDKDQPLSRVTTMEALIEQSLDQRRLSTVLLGLFAGMALLLASLGLYGLMSYAVAERSQEIGVRMRSAPSDTGCSASSWDRASGWSRSVWVLGWQAPSRSRACWRPNCLGWKPPIRSPLAPFR